MKPTSLIPLLASSSLLALLSACAEGIVDSQEVRSLDGVKLIAPEITDSQDPSSFEQRSYALSASRRLLLRYEALSDYVNGPRTENGHKIQLLISPATLPTPTPTSPFAAVSRANPDPDPASLAPAPSPSPSASPTPQPNPALLAAVASIKACPLKRNWMMAATWKRAHPFSRQGRWSSEGGDYDPAECVAATATQGDFAAFDVTPWFVNYVRGRRQNYGLILIHDPGNSATEVSGDASGAYSPRIQWTKSSNYPPSSPFPQPSLMMLGR
jgi:hypothetical protein